LAAAHPILIRRDSTRGLISAFLIAAPVLAGVIYCAAGAFGLLPWTLGRSGMDVLSAGATWRSVLWSLWAASASTAIAFIGALCIAVTFRSTGPLDRLARSLAVLPLPIPHIVAGLVGLLLLSQSGLLARVAYSLRWIARPADMPILIYDSAGIGFILTTAAKEIPFLALVALSLIGGELRQLEEGARTLGAGSRDLLRRITLPLLIRGMLPATVAVFVFVFGSYEVAAMLGPTSPAPLPVLINNSYSGAALGQRADAYMLSLLALLVASVAVAAHELLRYRAWNNGRA
jgi:putative spermidine/putrescine transport system permease protein